MIQDNYQRMNSYFWRLFYALKEKEKKKEGSDSEPESQHNSGIYEGGSNEILFVLISIYSHWGIVYISSRFLASPLAKRSKIT